jgi:hypothetical protein
MDSGARVDELIGDSSGEFNNFYPFSGEGPHGCVQVCDITYVASYVANIFDLKLQLI